MVAYPFVKKLSMSLVVVMLLTVFMGGFAGVTQVHAAEETPTSTVEETATPATASPETTETPQSTPEATSTDDVETTSPSATPTKIEETSVPSDTPSASPEVTASATPTEDSNEDVSPEEELGEEEFINQYTITEENDNGSYTTSVYAEPVRYQDEDGNWVEIDNSIVETETSTNGLEYTNKSAEADVLMAKDANQSALVALEQEKYKVSIAPIQKKKATEPTTSFLEEGTLAEAATDDAETTTDGRVVADDTLSESKEYEAIRYEKVFNSDTDILLMPENNGVKEDILLYDAPTTAVQYEFSLKVKNVTLELAEDNRVLAKDSETGEIVGAIPAPYMMDSADPQHYSQAIVVTLTDLGQGSFIYTLEPDLEYLQATSTVYPVSIDPSYTFTSGDDTSDTFLSKTNSTTNYKDDAILPVGKSPTYGLSRAMFKMIGLKTIIPANCDIITAYFKAYEELSSTTAVNIGAYEVTQSYDTGEVTWANQPTMSGTATSTKSVTGAGWYTWTVTSLVQKWYAASSTPASAIYLRYADETATTYKTFRSVNYTGTDYNPQFIVTYYKKPGAPTSVTVSPTNSWTSGNITVAWSGITVGDSDATLTGVEYSTTSATSGFVAISSPSGLAAGSKALALPEGTKSVWVRGVNSKVVKGVAKQSSTVYKRDATKPSAPASVSVSPSGSWTAGDITITYSTVTDSTSGVQKYQYGIGTSNTTEPTTYTDIPSGNKIKPASGTGYVWVRAVDNAGNVSAVGKCSSNQYQRDVINPAAPATVTVSPQTWTSGTITVAYTTASDNTGGSGINKYQYGVSTSSTTEPTTYADVPSNKVIPASVTGDGQKYIWVRSVDKAGNNSAGKCSTTAFSRDSVRPSTPPSNVKVNPTIWTNGVITVTYTAAADNSGGSGIKGYQYALSSSNTTAPTSGYKTLPANGQITPPEGKQYVWVRALDYADNVTATAACSATLYKRDATIPAPVSVIQLTNLPGQDATHINVGISYAAVTPDSGSEIAGYRIGYGKSGSSMTYVNNGLNYSYTVVGIQKDETWNFLVQALDAAGNASTATSSSKTFTDVARPQAPVTLESNTAGYTNNTMPTLSWTGIVDAQLTEVQAIAVPSSQASTFNPDAFGPVWTTIATGQESGSGQMDCASLADGDYRLYVRGLDASGNIGYAAYVEYKKDTQIEEARVTNIEPGDVLTDDLSLTAVIADARLSSWNVYADKVGSALFAGQGIGNGTNALNGELATLDVSELDEGVPYVLTLRVMDSVGNVKLTQVPFYVGNNGTQTIDHSFAITSPDAGATIDDTDVEITYSGASGYSDMQVFINGISHASVWQSGKSALSVVDLAEDSNNQYFAVGTDADGVKQYSVDRRVKDYWLDVLDGSDTSGLVNVVAGNGIKLSQTNGAYASSGSITTQTINFAESGLNVYSQQMKLDVSAVLPTTDTQIHYYLSFDQGDTWEEKTPGVAFDGQGVKSVLLRATLSTSDPTKTPTLYAWALRGETALVDRSFTVKLVKEPTLDSVTPNVNYTNRLRWTGAEDDVTYNVYRSKGDDFAYVTRVAEGIADSYWFDYQLDYGTQYTYWVTAVKTLDEVDAKGEHIKREGTPGQSKSATMVSADSIYGLDGIGDGQKYKDLGSETGSASFKLSNGSMLYNTEDISIADTLIPMDVSRVYNSLSRTQTPFGYGWDSSLNVYLLEEYAPIGEENPTLQLAGLILKDSNGSITHFAVDSQGAISTPIGSTYVLTKDTEDGGYNLKDTAGTVCHFGSDRRLHTITDSYGNQVEYTYDSATGNLSQVADDLGNALTFAYNADDMLVSVKDAARTVQYSYTQDPSGLDWLQSTSIQFTGSSSSLTREKYAYNTLTVAQGATEYGQLISVENANNLKDQYAYYSDADDAQAGTSWSGRLKNYTNPAGEVSTVLYEQSVEGYEGTATVYQEKDKDGEVKKEDVSIWFNERGQVSRILDPTSKRLDTYTYDQYYNVASIAQKDTGAEGDKTVTTSSVYDASGNLLSETSALGWKTVYTYDANNNLLTKTAPFVQIDVDTGATTTDTAVDTYTYDSHGNQLTHVNALGQRRTSAYNGRGQILTSTDHLGRVTTYAYDSKGRLISTEYPDGTVETIGAFNGWNLPIEGTSVAGEPYTVTYDAVGNDLVRTYNQGTEYVQTESTVYREDGRVLSNADRNGDATQYAYDEYGRLTTTTYSDGTTETNTYDGENIDAGEVETTTNIPTSTTNSTGSIGGSIGSLSTVGLTIKQTTTVVGTVSKETTIIDKAEVVAQFTYDAFGNQTLATDDNGIQSTYTYDAEGQLLTESYDSEGANLETSYKYDCTGNTIEGKAPSGDVVRTKYDKLGRVVKVKTVTNGNVITEIDVYDVAYTEDGVTKYKDVKTETQPNGNAIATDTSEDGNRVSVMLPVSGLADGATTMRNEYVYQDGNISSITHNGFTYSFQYDKGKKLTQVEVGGTLLKRNDYENWSETARLETETYGNGQNVEYSYDDSSDRVATVKRDGQNRFAYTYDSDGNMETVQDYLNDITIRYVPADEDAGTSAHVDVSNRAETQLLYSYEMDEGDTGSALRTTIGSGDDAEVYEYTYTKDDHDRASTVAYSLADGTAVTKTYNYSASTLRTLGYDVKLNGTTTLLSAEYTYQPVASGETGFRSLVSQETLTGGINQTINYTYDSMENITSITIGGVLKHSYAYDEANQLVRENDAVASRTTTYAYDAGGNLRTKKVYAYTTGTISGTPQDVVEYEYDGSWKDQLAKYDGQQLGYDGAGNLISYNGQTYTWDMGRRLQSISSSSLNTQYGYNAEGIRVSKTVNGTLTTYGLVNGRVIWEETDGQRIDYRYDGNYKLISMQLDNNEYFYVHNIQGDIVGLVDQTGGAVAHYAYDAWGVPTSITDGQGNDVSGNASAVANVNPYRYRGYRYDRETGLYYLQSRYYNPMWGRFISSDILYFDNVFWYCSNNPINYVDYYGYKDLKYTTYRVWPSKVLYGYAYRMKKKYYTLTNSKGKNISYVSYNNFKDEIMSFVSYFEKMCDVKSDIIAAVGGSVALAVSVIVTALAGVTIGISIAGMAAYSAQIVYINSLCDRFKYDQKKCDEYWSDINSMR